jgi:hypothetical protein
MEEFNMTKKEIATMVAETINGLEAGMAMVGEKDGQPSVIIGKESVRPSFNVTDDIANHVNACKNEDVYVALAEVAADMRAQYNAASKANPVTRDNILKTAKVCLRRAGSGKETDVVKPFAQGIEKYIRVDASCVQEDSSFVLADAVCKVTGVTLEEAWLAAEANVAADVNIMSIMDVLKEKGLLPADMEIEDPVPMLVVTNAATSFGAGVITSRRVVKRISQMLGETNLVLIPSSVHEILALPAYMSFGSNLSDLVKEVNGSEVAEEEQLSNNAYLCNAATGQLVIL